MLAKASAELKQNDYAGAQASAEVAKKNADKATEIAKPLYEQAEQTSQNKARDEALAATPRPSRGRRPAGTARRSAAPGDRGAADVQQAKAGHRPRTGRRPGADSPSCSRSTRPIRCRSSATPTTGQGIELLAVSAARAHSVYSALAAKGVETKRLMASGLGGDDPRFDNKSANGRAKNNRIEIVFLYH
jgi:hypothetical protein